MIGWVIIIFANDDAQQHLLRLSAYISLCRGFGLPIRISAVETRSKPFERAAYSLLHPR